MTHPWDFEPPPDVDELPPDPWDEPPADLAQAATAPPVPRPTRQVPQRGAVERGTDGLRDEALEVLRALTGRPEADFHDGQFEAIEALVAHHRRALGRC